ncbi:MAG: serpin family protein [Eubacteriales bacterium]
MKKIKFFIPIIAAALIFSACSPSPAVVDGKDEPSDVMLSISDVSSKNANDSQNIQLQFNLDLLKQLSKDSKNTFYSSFSINQALTMAYFGAGGETQQEIKDALGYTSLTIEGIAAYQKYLLDVYKDSGDTTFYSANSMWIDNDIIVKKNYIDAMIDNFDAEVDDIDLQSAKAPDTLNKWIDKKTNGMITKLFENPFDPLARVVLMNAIYFKGQWTTPFDPNRTMEREFNGLIKTSTVDMMYSGEEVLGNVGDGYMSISMPYGDDERFSMVAVLPDGDIGQFIDSLSIGSLSEILSTFEPKNEAKVFFPKFEMEEKVLLNDTLKALGINSAFYDGADFGEISDTDLYIDEVLHKAKIKVDEEGTEAAAVTGIVVKTESMPIDQFIFAADKPFLFFIIDNHNDNVLFTGVVYDLEK